MFAIFSGLEYLAQRFNQPFDKNGPKQTLAVFLANLDKYLAVSKWMIWKLRILHKLILYDSNTLTDVLGNFVLIVAVVSNLSKNE